MSSLKPVTAGIIVRDGKILLAQREKEDSAGGLWEFPGGGVEKNETPDMCIVRELKEEIDMDVKALSLYEAIPTDWGGIILIYLCVGYGTPKPIECQDIRWVAPEDLLLYPTHKSDLQMMRRISNNPRAFMAHYDKCKLARA